MMSIMPDNFLNKAELMSRSGRITEELEARLRQRRQEIELKAGDENRPKVLQHIDILAMEAKQIRERANKSCRANLKHKLNAGESGSEGFEKRWECGCCARPSVKATCAGGRKRVDGSAGVLLPKKRESIRMLYENKAVSENPLKSTLESHFYNINASKGLRMKLSRLENEK